MFLYVNSLEEYVRRRCYRNALGNLERDRVQNLRCFKYLSRIFMTGLNKLEII